MNKEYTDISNKTAIKIAGIGLIMMYVFAVMDVLFVDTGMVVWSNAAKTFTNIKESAQQYRLHVFFFLLIFMMDIVVSMGLYLVLRPVNKTLSLLGAWFRVMYTAMIGAVTINQLDVLQLVSNSEYLSVFNQSQLDSMVMLSLKSYANGFSYALIFFGVHILLVSYLVFNSGYISKIVGVILFAAFIGYVGDGMINLLFNKFRMQYKEIFEGYLGITGFIGELILALYIIIKRKKIEEDMSNLDKSEG